jgi:hypothetical protein
VSEFTRLTRDEYSATVRAALGVTPAVNDIPEDGRVGPFTSNLEVTPDPVHPYLLKAEQLAASVVPSELPECESAGARACLEEHYAPVIEQLYRRELLASDLDTLEGVIHAVSDAAGTATDATRTMLATTLLSPDFLYRASPSANGFSQAQDDLARRLAERISFALWDAPPDTDLRAGVSEADDLDAALRLQATRLSRDERATGVLARFVGQWLDVDTDLRRENPEFESDPDYLELVAFVSDAVVNDTPVRDFVAGTRGFVHRDNRSAYELETEADDTSQVASVTWSASSDRRGLLAQELFAGSTRHPDLSRREIFRGLLVRRSLLCNEIPAPSADLVALAGEVGDRTEDPRCLGCHQLIDPIGRAFAGLDQDVEGAPPAPQVLAHPELEGDYQNLAELLEAIGASRAFAECFSKHWLGFFLEQPLTEVDATWTAALADSIEAGASLGTVLELTVSELLARSEPLLPWCEGP